jgi:dTDP-4-dehydrorhamnose 3,5-epimerase
MLTGSAIEGVLITPQRCISTPGGDVYHAMKAGDPGYAGFGEAYFSTIDPGAIKPWKRHLRMTLNLVVISGKVRFIVHDLRVGSASFGHTATYVLGPELPLNSEDAGYARLTVPPGLWMAFQGRSDRTSILLNLADLRHQPDEAERQPLEFIPFDWETA